MIALRMRLVMVVCQSKLIFTAAPRGLLAGGLEQRSIRAMDRSAQWEQSNRCHDATQVLARDLEFAVQGVELRLRVVQRPFLS